MAKRKTSQLEVTVDGAGVKAGVDGIKADLDKLASGAEQAGKRAGAGLDGIGAGADGSSQKVDRATKSIIASIERATAAAKAGGRGTAEFYESLGSGRGVNGDALKPYIDGLRQAEAAQRAAAGGLGKMEMSAKQTTAALRQVPAQFTDIIVSLQGGQAPLTVLLQQGGQLKDVFGGVGAAAQALGGYIASLVTPFTVAAAAGAGLLYLFVQGQKEGAAFQQTIISSGNVAGVTAGQLSGMADAVSKIGGTRGEAAEVLNQIAASGEVAATSMVRFTAVALEFERAGGQAATKTADAFAELGRAPLTATLKLNEGMNYLTASTYEQIRSLEEQGRSTDAARVAQDAFADALARRSPEMVASLGAVERQTIALKRELLGMVDALKNVGRPENAPKLKETFLQGQIDRNLAERKNFDAAGQAEIDKRVAGYALQLSFLKSIDGAVERGAEAERARAKDVEKLIGFRAEEAKLADNGVRRARELAQTREKYEDLVKKGLITQAEYNKLVANIQDRLKDPAPPKAARAAKPDTRAADEEAVALLKLAGLTTSYSAELDVLNRLRVKGKIDTEQYGEAVRALVAQQPFQVKYTRELAEAEKQAAAVERERLKDYEKADEAQRRALETGEKEIQSLRLQYEQLVAGKAGRQELTGALLDEQAALLEAQSIRQLDADLDVTEFERRKLRIAQLREEADLRRGIAGATADKEVEKANAKAAEDAYKEWDKASDKIGESLAGALLDGGKSASQQLKALFSRLVLQPLLKPLANDLASYAQAFGLSGGDSAAGARGAAQAGSSLQQIGSLASSAYSYAGKAYSALFGPGASSAAAYAPATNAALAESAVGTAGYGASSAGAGGAGGATGLSAASMTTLYAAFAVWAYGQSQKDYEKGFTNQAAFNSQKALGGSLYANASLETVVSRALKAVGFNDKWSSILSGATPFARIFGRADPRVERQGISGTFGGGDFTGNAYADILEKGGFLRKDKRSTQTGALDPGIDNLLSDTAKALRDKAKEYGAALGLPVDALDGITKAVKITFTEDNAKNAEELKKALTEYGEVLVAGWAGALESVARYGESITDTIARVGGAIKGANEVLEQLGVKALDASVAGGKAAEGIANLFGGLGNLQQASQGYYQNFFTQAERSDKALGQLEEALASVGVELPRSREEFRQTVEALDVGTEAGQRQFAALLQVQGVFAELNPVLEATAEAARSAVDILKERQGLELEYMKLVGDAAGIRAVERAALDESNRAMYDKIRAEEALQAATTAAAAAAADAASLAAQAAQEATARVEAIEAQRKGLTLELLRLQGDIGAIREIERNDLLDDGNRAIYDQIKAIEDQNAAQEAARSAWSDTSSAIQSGAETVRNAFESVWPSLTAEIKRLRGVATDPAATLADFATTTAQARAGDANAAGRLPELTRALSDQARGLATNKADLDVLQGKLASSLERTQVATGGQAVGYQKLSVSMEAQTEQMVSALAQIASVNGQLARLWAKFDADGMPAVRT